MFPAYQTYIVLMVVVLGLAGNILNLLVLNNMKKSVFEMYLRGLSCIDLAFLLQVSSCFDRLDAVKKSDFITNLILF